MKSINALQKCEWRINKKIMSVVNYFFDKGFQISGYIINIFKGLPGKFDESLSKIDKKNVISDQNYINFNHNLSSKLKEANEIKKYAKNFNEYISIYSMCLLKIKTANELLNGYNLIILKIHSFSPIFLILEGDVIPIHLI